MTALVHVTHEAVQKVGGIGAVLQGLVTSRAYGKAVQRTILLGPLADPHSSQPLGDGGTVIYDNWRGIWSADVGPALYRLETSHGVRIVYGRRRLSGREEEAEVVLVDVNGSPRGLAAFKLTLYERFGLASDRYEGHWEYEQYTRLAEPGYDAVMALLGDAPGPYYFIAHEFMGMATALKAIQEGDRRVATVFYAHEVATVRRLVEDSPGHDVMFYNALRAARRAELDLADVFGDQSAFFKHALVSLAWHCDGVIAVGDWVVEELRFLGAEFGGKPPELVYNGVPAVEIDLEAKRASQEKLATYVEELLHFRPDYVFTHVTRLVESKALYRDLMVCQHVDGVLEDRGHSAVLIVLGTEVGPRAPSSIAHMVKAYEWPLVHQEGYPDLAPGELAFDLRVRVFNTRSRAVKVLFVNQFGWDRRACGPAMPADMSFQDMRRGSDVEFGQSMYEPFGIAQIEPLSFGSISVISDACGCLGFLEQVAQPDVGTAGYLRADYTALAIAPGVAQAGEIGAEECRQAELATSKRVAEELCRRLPTSDADRVRLLKEGYATAAQMSWERVVEDAFLPTLRKLDPSLLRRR